MSKKHLFIFVPILLLGVLLITACSNTPETTPTEEIHDEEASPEAGEDHGHVETPDEYADLSNPFAGDQQALEAGEVIYQANCASCHGIEGAGDGPVADVLDPKPSDITDTHMMEELSDGYLFWRIKEGGDFEPFNSSMPAWEETLTEEEHWQVISFIRLFVEDH